jgi:tetratricopeptide (TPR) repeat protein
MAMTTVEQYLKAARHAHAIGNPFLAGQVLAAALMVHPEQPALLTEMALICHRNGSVDEAVEWFERAATAEGSPASWSNLASALCDASRFQEALAALQQARQNSSGDAFMGFCAARALSGLGRKDEALQEAAAAVHADPEDTDYRLLRADIAAALDYREQAAEDLEKLIETITDPARALQVASLLMRVGRFEAALSQYRLLASRLPESFDAWIGLALASERANDLAGLAAALTHAARLVRVPFQQVAVNHLRGKQAYRDGEFDQACTLMDSAWKLPDAETRWKAQVGFDYALSLDRNHRFGEAWNVLVEAHALQAPTYEGPAILEARTGFFRILQTAVPVFEGPPCIPDGRTDPVFVVGFPRSGTTLLEQILDSRPGLKSFDEKPYLVKTLLEFNALGLRYPEDLDRLDTQQIAVLRTFYFEQVEADLESEGQRVVDKNPLNWVYLPFIQTIFPQSNIILALRHPLDVVLSCYMQNLRSTGNLYSSIDRIAELYVAMADFWQRLQPDFKGAILTTCYEDLIADPMAETQRLAMFLDMPWNESWLDSAEHARRKGIISTPSYAQVLEPLNSRAIGRWRHYRPYFDPEVMARLTPAIAAMGYSLD